MIAMVLAAGKGTRLRPLTDETPKALVTLDGHPLLYYILTRIYHSGIKTAVVNVHHRAEQIIKYLEQDPVPGLRIHISDERKKLLDTGGALRHAAPLLRGQGDVLVHNVDVISDLAIEGLLARHTSSGARVTLAVRDRLTSRYLIFDESGQLVGWRHKALGEYRWSRDPVVNGIERAFSGVHIFSQDLLDRFPEQERFSLIHHYLSIAADSKVASFDHTRGFWKDVGKPADLQAMEDFFSTDEGRTWKTQYLRAWSHS